MITVLVISAVGIAATVSILLLGIGSAKTSITLARMGQARQLANTCLETALEKVRDDNNFSGSATLTLVQGSCSYSVPAGGSPKTISASGTAGTAVRKVRVTLTAFKPRIILSSWQEVAD